MTPEPMNDRVMRKLLAGYLMLHCHRCGKWTNRVKDFAAGTGECGRCENAIKREQQNAGVKA